MGEPEQEGPDVVTVSGIAAGGDGVGALPDGRVIFLPRTVPGDRVRVEVIQEKARWGRGEVTALLQEGPDRCVPPCPHYADCDACHLQHLSYAAQLMWKGRVVGDALRRIGGFELGDPPVDPSPEQLRYRNKISFTLRRIGGGGIVAGFRDRRRRGRVVDVGTDCLLPEESLREVWKELREGWGTGASLLPLGRELKLTLRSGAAGAGLVIAGGKGDGEAGALLSRVSGLSSIWRREKGGALRFLAGEESFLVEWLGETLEMPGGGFLQVNTAAAEALHRCVLRGAGPVDGIRVIDAYCGVGSLGRSLADMGGRVVGIEADPLAVDVAEARAPASQEVVEGRVEELLGDLLPADLIVLNPPRGGLHGSLPPLLTRTPVRRLVYVSCDPATLARDLERLRGAYQVEEARSFDLFPQTAHVETVVTLDGTKG